MNIGGRLLRSFSRIIPGLVGWGAASLLVGCAPVGPAYQAPRPELPATWNGAAGEPDARAGHEELGHWWTMFNDPLLTSLIERGVAANPDLKIAETRLQQARAQYRLTTGAAAPTLGVSGSYANSRKSANVGGSGGGDTQDLFQTGFDAGWELDVFGGVRRADEAAEARLVAAGESRNEVLVSLAAEIARDYLELRGSQQRLLTIRGNLAVQEKTLALAKGRRESGLGNELEVAQAETQLAQTSAQLPALENSVGQSIYQLALLQGLPPQALQVELSTVAPLPAVPAHLPETLPSELLRRRPDIRRAERQLAAATADVGVATAELFPRFSLTGLVGLQSLNLSELLSSSSRYWAVGPTVRWSLLNGGRVRANIDLTEAQREEAQVLYEKTVLNALNEVEAALLAMAREEDTHRTLAGVVASSQRTVDLAIGSYRSGLTGVLDVLLAERALHSAQDQLIQSEQRQGVNLVALYKALGGGWIVSQGMPEISRGAVSPGIAVLQSTPAGDLKK